MSKKKDTPIEYRYEGEEGENDEYTKKIRTLKSQLDTCQKEKKEYLDGWQRLKADFINTRRGHDEEQKSIRIRAREDIIMDLLPVVDSFEMAFKGKEAWEKVDPVWRTGVEYIYNQLIDILGTYGLVAFDAVGKPFDPRCHLSVDSVTTTKKEEDGNILEVIQRGFMLQGKVVRPASVKVAQYKK